ncbi:MAG: GNAT family N-acetyltransferase [Candidatus Dormibacteria bacterium]
MTATPSVTDPETGQPIGPAVDPGPAALPQAATLRGRFVELQPLSYSRHGAELWEQLRGPANDRLWRYLADGPHPDPEAFRSAVEARARSQERAYWAIVDVDDAVTRGWASLMRIEPQHGCIEVGDILYSPRLQRTRSATEAMYLLARHVFEELRYRRYEWKCDALNQPSRRAALRLGFTYEGTFRQHMIIKGRSRDTAWFSISDGEWPARRDRLERWLDPSNFDLQGHQHRALSEPGAGRPAS